jgi:ribonuclease VapC
MLVVDTSALIALVLEEEGYDAVAETLLASPRNLMSAVCVVEACEVYARKFDLEDVGAALMADLNRLRIDAVGVDLSHMRLAIEARVKFGKGRHPAKLNFGDCFSYALAKAENRPLLFKGNDFAETDVEVAAY